MTFLKIAILLTVFGTAMSDYNKTELCSRKYYDRINGSVGNRNGIQLIRKLGVLGVSYHSWNATLEFNNNTNFYSLSQISYNLKDSKDSPLKDELYNNCSVLLAITNDIKYQWFLDNFTLVNEKENPVLKVTQEVKRMTPAEAQEEPILNFKRTEDLVIKNGADIRFIGLICDTIRSKIYAIGQNKSSMNSTDRTQLVGLIEANITPKEVKSITIPPNITVNFKNELQFKPINKTVFEFFDIDCTEPTLKPTPIPTQNTKTSLDSIPVLLIVGVVVVAFVIIALLAIIWLCYRRWKADDESIQGKGSSISSGVSSSSSKIKTLNLTKSLTTEKGSRR